MRGLSEESRKKGGVVGCPAPDLYGCHSRPVNGYRQKILDQPKIRLEVKDSEGWVGPKFPEDVDELHFQVVGVIKDVERLKALFDLFAAVLDQLCRIGSARRQEAGVEL
jgi:hypothetical protein